MIDKFQEEKYRLKRNPFTGYRATKEELKFWVNREKEIVKYNKVINEALNHPEDHYIFFLIGDYGMGKSLSIFKIEQMYQKNNQVFPLVFNFIGEDRMRRPGIELIQRIFKYVDFKRISITKKQIEKLSVISMDVARIYNKIFFSEEETRNSALYFMRGQLTPNQTQMKNLEIKRRMNDIETAQEYFKGFLYLLKLAGYKTLLLLIDEFEYLFSLVQKSQRDFYFAILRGLYDLPTDINKERTANILFFLGISNDEYRRMRQLDEAEKARKIEGPVNPFLRRVYDQDELTPLKRNDVEDLINLRLRYNRVEKRFEKIPLIPYTKDFIEFIWDNTRGKPADIIYKCGHVLDLGIKYKVTHLNKKFAIDALEERNIV